MSPGYHAPRDQKRSLEARATPISPKIQVQRQAATADNSTQYLLVTMSINSQSTTYMSQYKSATTTIDIKYLESSELFQKNSP